MTKSHGYLEQEGVAIRSGHHCTQPLHRLLGAKGSARASLYIYNTFEEVRVCVVCVRVCNQTLRTSLTAQAIPACSSLLCVGVGVQVDVLVQKLRETIDFFGSISVGGGAAL